MSDPMRPHSGQSTRLPHPWDSPGKNTGVGYHFLLQCMKMKSESEVAQSCPTLSDPMYCSLPSSSVHGILQARVLEWVAIAFSDHTSRRLLLKIQICSQRMVACKIFSKFLNQQRVGTTEQQAFQGSEGGGIEGRFGVISQKPWISWHALVGPRQAPGIKELRNSGTDI